MKIIGGKSPSEAGFNIGVFNDFNFQTSFGAYHEIKDVNTDFLILSLKVSSLYTVDKKGNTNGNSAVFGIKIGYKLRDDYACYIAHRVAGIATSPYAFDLFFDVSDFDFSLGPYIKVFNLNQRSDPTNSKAARSIGTSSITEITSLKFRYPNTCYFLNVFDARGFTQPPNRQFDFKLLKIKVPENYDAESKTYDGFWSGEFDSVLRWTDNPAWILYDLITNYRYGLGKFSFQESLADKWSLYKIAKYCDELVSTENVSKFQPVLIEKIYRNSIDVKSDTDVDFTVYFPIGSKIDLVNLSFLTKFKFGNYGDTARKQATIRYLQYLSTSSLNPITNIHFIQMAYESDYRERNFNTSTLKIDQLFTGRSTSGTNVYPGDREVKLEDTICIQIHKVKLKCKQTNKFVGKIIYTLAIYYPENFASGYISSEPENFDIEDDAE